MENLMGRISTKMLKYRKEVSGVIFLLAILCIFQIHESHAGQWVQMTSGTKKWLSGVWGSSVSEVFAVGSGEWTGQGYESLILHYDGKHWTQMTTDTDSFLQDVWGSSASNVFAVGGDSTILHYDGDQWSEITSGNLQIGILYDIWGASGSDVFVVGMDSTVLHYDGNQWTWYYFGTDDIFNCVWGSSASDVFVGGSDTAVLNYKFIAHYNGNTIDVMLSGENIPSAALWGSSGSDVFAVGEQGRIFHYNGSTWSEMSHSATSNNLRAVWGNSGTDVFAVGEGSTILHYDGSQWSKMNSGISGLILNDVWGVPGGGVFAVGDKGTILYYGDPPTAAFSGEPRAGEFPLTVNFTDSSIGDVSTRSWSFGDGATSTDQNPSHAYATPGIYTVSLNVGGPAGSDTMTRTSYIMVKGTAMPWMPLLLDD